VKRKIDELVMNFMPSISATSWRRLRY